MKPPSSALWRDHREKVLYLVVGAWNTLFSYACFSLLYYLFHEQVFSSVILVVSYAFASVNGFLGFRYIVFRSKGHPVAEYLRFQLVYVPLLAVNAVALPLFLAYTDLNAYVVQAGWAVVAVVGGYLGNKYFTFRRGTVAEPGELPVASAADDTERRR